jgi:hypothetical protein
LQRLLELRAAHPELFSDLAFRETIGITSKESADTLESIVESFGPELGASHDTSWFSDDDSATRREVWPAHARLFWRHIVVAP